MGRRLFVVILIIIMLGPLVGTTSATPSALFVCILVHSSISDQISLEITRYVADLKAEGLDSHVVIWDKGDHLAVRAFLQNEYSKGMIGALLVGDVPYALWENLGVDDYPPRIFDDFYMDLDGAYEDTNNNNIYDKSPYWPPPPPEQPTLEIWVGRLHTSNMDIDEVSLLKKYFDKNHLYRTGHLTLPFRALNYYDDTSETLPEDFLRECAYKIDECMSMVFTDRTVVWDPLVTTASDYLEHLKGSFTLIRLGVHGSPTSHHFREPGGKWSIVSSSDIRSIDPKAFFFNLMACSNGRFIDRDYIAGWYVFGSTYGLAAIAAGGVSGGESRDDGDFYKLFRDQNLGSAFKYYKTRNGIDSFNPLWSFMIIGDPTLRLLPPSPPPPVGGLEAPTNPLTLLAPWIFLALATSLGTIAAAKRKRKH